MCLLKTDYEKHKPTYRVALATLKTFFLPKAEGTTRERQTEEVGIGDKNACNFVWSLYKYRIPCAILDIRFKNILF